MTVNVNTHVITLNILQLNVYYLNCTIENEKDEICYIPVGHKQPLVVEMYSYFQVHMQSFYNR